MFQYQPDIVESCISAEARRFRFFRGHERNSHQRQATYSRREMPLPEPPISLEEIYWARSRHFLNASMSLRAKFWCPSVA